MKRSRLVRLSGVVMSCVMLLCSCQGNGGSQTGSTESNTTQSSGVTSTMNTTTSTQITLPTASMPIVNQIDYKKIAADMQEKFDSMVKNSTKNSVKFAIMDNGELVVSGSSGQAANEDTIYGIASSGKMMAVCAVMQLVEDGKVELDAPVVKYVPEFTMQDERYKQITVRMLMNHSSGLMGNTCSDGWKLGAFEDTSYHDSFLQKLSTQRLRSAPGAYSNYCNDGFTLLEFVCEKVSGMSYSQYLRKEIFEPLGMDHTFSPLEKFDTSMIATSDYGGMGTLAPLTVDPAQGGMYSNAVDLCRFGNTFTNKGTSILSSASVLAMAQPEYKNGVWCEDGNNTMNYGLGWDSADFSPFKELGIKAVAKNGDLILSGSQMIILPEYNIVATVSCNGVSSSSCKEVLAHTLLRILQEGGAIDKMPEHSSLSEIAEPVSEDISKFEGTYVRSSGAFRVSFTDNSMVVAALPANSKTTYRHVGNGHFTNDGNTDYWFEEKDGKHYLIYRSWGGSDDTVYLPTVSYQGVKVEEPQLSEDVLAAWRARKGKIYLLVSEPYDSFGYIYQTYGLALPAYQLSMAIDPDNSPFWRGMVITGANSAQNVAEAPISGSTNTVDAEFTQVDGVEYITLSNGLVYRSIVGIEILDPTATISAGEQTRWYRSNAAQTIKYSIPENCAVAVYSSAMKRKTNTAVTHEDTITLKAGDLIAFIGNGEFKVIAE